MPEPMTKRDAVRNLQRYLRRLSYEDNDILAVPVDGIFDTRTTEALIEFQKMMGFPQTGRADKATWDALFLEYSRLRREEDRQDFPEFFPKAPPNYVTTPGESGSFITLLQFLLGELTASYDTFPLVVLSGVYDESTAAAVREFQRISLLPMTGQVNRNTWNRLAEEYNRLIS
ncbi:MAG: peptidoglycan-binding protein [Clostridia bacterium]|nr:peptidoglycan-binding protein [Clostridia bacterium]